MIRKTTTIIMLAVAALAFTGIAAAQDNAGAASQQQQKTQQLVKQLRQKAVKLRQIQQETLKANPDLRKQQQDFISMVKDEIKNQGYDLDAGKKRVESLTEKLKSGNLSKDQRKDVMQKFMSERRSLEKARVAALREPKVQKAGKQLQQSMLTAMQADNDDTTSLIHDMKDLRKQLRASVQTAPAQ